MEGDGEGLVAIVQGLENSGVTLTVCNRTRLNLDRSRPPGHRIQINGMNQRLDFPAIDHRTNMLPAVPGPPALCPAPVVQRNSVETSTGTDFSRMTTASQICDGRYASSYKLAHCMVSPTSPPEAVTEFPPQRKEPCRNQGNFEIGGQSSAQWSRHGIGHNVSSHGTVLARVSTSKVRHYGGTQTWADKGSSHRYSKSNHRETEAFAHSLRKYPSMAPFRTASTDLIEKLIRYTQAKNYQNMSRSTKSLRSLRHQKPSDTNDSVRASKHQQTYTRAQDDRVTSNSHVQVGHRSRTKKYKLYAPMSESRHLRESRHRDTICSSSYDYLKAGNSPHGRSNRSDGSHSPTCSRSPERKRRPEESPSPERSRSPEGSRVIRAELSSRADRPLRLERSVRDLSLSEMSRYIRSTIRQICNERPVVVQVCPKLKDRFNQHKKICPIKNERSDDVMEFDEEEEEPEAQASGSVLSRFLQTFSGRAHSTAQTGCQCIKADCYCSKATQCVNNPDISTSTAACSCTTANKSCCRGMTCICATKAQAQEYYNKRIDEEISEWLKEVPVTSIEDAESKKKREIIIQELRKALKQLPDDENFEEDAGNKIQRFVDYFHLWNPGEDENDEMLFKNQLADKLTEKIIAIPRKPDRFRDVVKKWIANLDFEGDSEEVDKDAIIDNFVNKLKSVAADRPVCDVKYMIILKKEIIELLVERALKFDGDMILLRKTANNLAKEIVRMPRNVNLSGDTSDLTSEFEDKIADWICEHGLCNELKRNPKLIEGLAKKLNKLKSQGIYDDDVTEQMQEELQQLVDDVGLAYETVDQLIEELMKQLSTTIQINEKERLDQEELFEEVSNWLRSLPGDDLPPRKLEKMTKDLVKMIQASNEEKNYNLANDIFDYVFDMELSINSADLGIYVEELMDKLKILPGKLYKEQAKKMTCEDRSILGRIKKLLSEVATKHLAIYLPPCVCDIKKEVEEDVSNLIDRSSIETDQKRELKENIQDILIENKDRRLTDEVIKTIQADISRVVSDVSIPEDEKDDLKMEVNETVLKDFNEAGKAFRHNLNKLKNKLLDDITNVIEKSPIPRNVKSQLKDKLNNVLAKNLDSSLSNDEKHMILDDLSKIDRKDMSKDKRISLTNKLAKKLDIQPREEVKRRLIETMDILSIDSSVKDDMKQEVEGILLETLYNPLSNDVKKKIQEDIMNVIDELDIPEDVKNNLMSDLSHAIAKEVEKLNTQNKEVPEIKMDLEKVIAKEIKNSPISKDEQEDLKNRIKLVLTENLDQAVTDEAKETIKERLEYIVDDLITDKGKADAIKTQLLAVVNKDFTKSLPPRLESQSNERLRDQKRTMDLKEAENEALDNIVLEMERAVDKAPVPRGQKIELKKILKYITIKNFEKSLDDITEGLKDDISEIFDKLNIPQDRKNKLKEDIIDTVEKNMEILLEKAKDINTQYPEIEYGDNLVPEEVATKDNILKGIEKYIEESAIPKGKKSELKRKLNKLYAENLEGPLSQDVQDNIYTGIADIVEELPITKSEKFKFQSGLTDIVDENIEKLRDKRHSEVGHSNKVEDNPLQNIFQEMGRAIEKASIPREKKKKLKNKLNNLATQDFNKIPSENVAEAIEDNTTEIIDELNLPKDKKNKLKTALLNAVHGYQKNLQTPKEDKTTEYLGKKRRQNEDTYRTSGISLKSMEEVDATKVNNGILKEIDKNIEQSDIPEEKKVELKRKLKKLVAENLKKPLSQDVQDTIRTGIADVMDDISIPKSAKNKLKRALINMVDEDVDHLRSAPHKMPTRVDNLGEMEKEPLHKTFQEVEIAIEEASIPRSKKKELKKKLKNLATKNFNKKLSDDTAEALGDDVIEIIDELNLPKHEKNNLKTTLLNDVHEYQKNLQTPKEDKTTDYLGKKRRQNEDAYRDSGVSLKPIKEVDATKDSILKGIDKNVDQSAIPEEKKVELKRKLKKLVAENLEQPFSQDVQDAIKTGIADVMDDMSIPTSEKNKLKRKFINMVDEDMDHLRDALHKMPAQVNDLRELEKEPLLKTFQEVDHAIEESSIPRRKKTELKKKLKNLATKNFNKKLSDDAAEALGDDVIEIIDELNLPKDKKNNLKTTLLDDVHEYQKNLQTPKEDNTTDYLGKKRRQNEDTYRNSGVSLKPIKEVDATKDSILKGITKNIEQSPIPEEKKVELKRKLKKLVAENLEQPFSQDVQDAIKTGIADVMDDMSIPSSEKNKLKRKFINMVDEDMDHLRDALHKMSAQVNDLRELEKELLLKTFQEVDHAIEESSIPRRKKTELKKKLKNLATKNFNKKLSDDAAEALGDDVIEIIDELNLPKDKKNNLKTTLLNDVHEYQKNLQTPKEDKTTDYLGKKRRQNKDAYRDSGVSLKPIKEVDATKDSILKGIDKNVEQSAIPEEKKVELKRKLKKLVAENLEQPFSQDVQDAIKTGIADVMDDMSIPTSEKNKLKRTFINMVDEDMDHLRDALHKMPAQVNDLRELEKEPLLKTFQEVDHAIEESSIPRRKKTELKKKLKNLATKNFNKKLSDDAAKALGDDVIEIIDELNLPKDKKNNLKTTLFDDVHEYQKNLLTPKEDNTTDYLGKKRRQNEDTYRNSGVSLKPIKEVDATKDSILKGIDKNIVQSAIPEEKKVELKRKLKKLVTENLEQPFSQDVQDAIKIGIADVMDDMSIPTSEKNKLKRTFINMVDKDMDHLRDALHKMPAQVNDLRELEKEPLINTFQEVDRAIEEASIPRGKKTELKKKLKNLCTKNFNKKLSHDAAEALGDDVIEILDELNLPKDKKSKLKSALFNAESEYVRKLQAAKQKDKAKVKNNIFQGIEKIVAESAVPERYKSELKKKLKSVAAEKLQKALSGDVQDNTKTAAIIADIIDGLPILTFEKNKLKTELTCFVNENIDKSPSKPSDRIDRSEELEDQPLHNIYHEMELAIKEASLPKEKKNKLKNMLRDLVAKDFDDKSLDEVAEAVKDDMIEIIDEMNSPKDKNNKLKSTIKDMIDENVEILRDESSEPPTEVVHLEEFEDNTQRNILQRFENVVTETPIPDSHLRLKRKLRDAAYKNFKKPFSDEVAESLKNDTILIKDDLNLPKDKNNTLKKNLSALEDENMNNYKNENKVEEEYLPPYQSTKVKVPWYQPTSLEKRRSISHPNHIIDESNLKESITDEVKKSIAQSKTPDKKKSITVTHASKVQIVPKQKDQITEYKEAFTTAINNAVQQSTVSKSSESSLKNKLLKKLKQTISKSSNKTDTEPLKAEVLQECRKIIDASSIPTSKKKELESLLKKEMAKALGDEITDGEGSSDDEMAHKQEIGIQEHEEVTPLSKVQIFPKQKDEITEYKEAFTTAINNAVEQSTVSKPNTSNLKNKLLKNLKQTINESSNKNDIGALRAEVLQECRNNIDASSIPAGKKTELKSLLKKQMAKALGDEITDGEGSSDDEMAHKQEIGIQEHEEVTPLSKVQIFPKQKDEITEYKEAFTTAINNAVEKSTVSKPNTTNLKNKLLKKLKQTINESSNKNDIGALRAEVLQECRNNIDASSIPAGKKTELKSLLKKQMAKALGDEITDDEGTSEDEMAHKQKTGIQEHEEVTPLSKVQIFPKQKDEITEYKEAFTTAINNAVEKSTVSKPNTTNLKNKLLKKLKQTINESSNKNDTEPLKAEVLQECRKIIDASSIPTGKKKELESLLKKEIAKALGDEITDDEGSSDDEMAHKQKTGIQEHEEVTPLSKVQFFPKQKDEITEYKEAFTTAINNAVEQSTVSKPNTTNLKNKLLNKLKQTISKSSNKTDTEPLKAEVLQECRKIIDASSIPTGKKKELESLLKKEIAKALGDEITDDEGSSDDEMAHKQKTGIQEHEEVTPLSKVQIFPKQKDEITEYKEALTTAINNAVEKSTVSKPNESSLKNKLLNKLKQTISKSSNKTDTEPLKAEVLQECRKIIDASSIPTGKKKELESLLKKEIAKALGDEITDDEGSSDDEMAHKQKTGIQEHEEVTPLSKVQFFPKQKDEITEYKEAFTTAINNAVEKSTVSKPNESSLKNKLLKKLKQTINESSNKNDIEALKAEVLQECRNNIDASSIPTGKKKELESFLKKEMAKALGDEITDDEESSDDDISEESTLHDNPTPEEYKEKILQCIKTWMESLPMDYDPEAVTSVAEDLASDIIDRQNYFQVHPDVISADNDEIENLKYQVFRRMNNVVEPKDMPLMMDRTEELYRMIIGIEPPEGVPKLQQSSSREQCSSEKQRRDQAPPNRKRSASTALSPGNINYSLKELIATNKSARKQWSRQLNNALSKLPLLKSDTKDLKEKLAIYDETGKINVLSALSTTKEETNNAENSKSSENIAPKPALKINKGKTSERVSKIEEAFSFNTSKQKSPFTPNSNDPAAMRDFPKKVKDSINNWLKKARVDIDQNEKNRVLEELLNDIVCRQKYIQTFGKTPSRSENLEYLKLQIHRRFDGLVPVEVLKKIIEKTKDLLPQIEKVQSAQLGQVSRLSQVVQRSPSHAKRKLGPADILGIRSKATNTTRAYGVSHTVDDDDGVEDDSEPEFIPGQASTPSKSATEQQEAADADYLDKVIESVTKWIQSMPIDLDPDVQSDVINDLTSDIVDRQKYFQMHPDKKFSDDEEIENLRFQLFKRLDKVLHPDSSVTPTLAKIEELYKMIAGDGRKKSLTAKQAQEFQTALNEEISAILNNYHICCDKRELLPKLANELTKLRKSGANQDEIVENLISTIQPLTYLSDEDAEELAYKLLFRTKKLIATIRGDVPVKKKDVKEAMREDIGDDDEAEGDDLENPLEESNAIADDTGPESKSRYGMSFNGLSNFIDTWLSSIHTDDDDTKDEDELMEEKRARMYSLVHKIGEMNVDPEIFNDDALYETVLREELQHVLGDIKMDEEEFQALKEDLVEKVLEAQRRAHDEIAGQNYKKKLRDTLSTLLPDQNNLSKDDQATMETLKDQLADAYIDLHYSGNDENQRDRLKRKIANEINTFCKDYLNRNPCSPLNSKTLNNYLYTALNKVPLPPGDSIRYEVEQARIREEINDWVKELPIQPQSPTELLARNKLIYVLSKKLFDIEVEEHEEDEASELMREQIVSFLNKLPLESEEESDAIADTLINKLKASEESRKYNATSNVTVDAAGNVTAASTVSSTPSICRRYKWLFEKRKPCDPYNVCARHSPRRFESLPPCTLSPEDKVHLEKIRRRTCVTPGCVASKIKKHKCDAGAGPPPVDAGSQTLLRPFGADEPQQNRMCPFAHENMPKPCPRVFPHPHQPCPQGRTESVETEKPLPSPICPAAFEKIPRTCPAGTSKSPQSSHQIRRCTISSTNISDCNEEVQPNVNTKQYNWDPCDKNTVDDSEQQQNGRNSRRQSDTPPCHPAFPYHPPRTAPSSAPRPAPCRPASCVSSRPCRRPACPSPRPATCLPPGPCAPSPPCFSHPTPPCRRSSSAKLKQQCSPQPNTPRQNSSERYSYCDPQNSFAKSSHRDTPISRSPCAPSPCMSSLGQCTPPGSTGFSKRFNECRMPKRDGLQDQEPCSSSKPSQKERVFELGSLDDVNARPKKRPSEQSDWPKFHEDDHFWAAPIRRVMMDEGIDESVVMERERREERVTCRCKERLVPNCGRSQPGNCPSQPFSTANDDAQNLKRCSKCCGIHCPYPSFLYFRQ